MMDISMTDKINTHFFKRLSTLYFEMDRAWKTAADHYGFNCKGCTDNCCETQFYHHTHMEKNYLLHGMTTLSPLHTKEIKTRAREVNRLRHLEKTTGETTRVMCPLNMNGLCRLYEFRPMICRLHGIPHELQRPGSYPAKGPGCKAGAYLFSTRKYHAFDRTPFYSDMASLEMDYRTAINTQEKLRQTIAEMIAPQDISNNIL